ncbi:helix-turn-helix domain-containing protein [Lachnospiraceae bacterium OttesenSCG-928-D06]|nr:helix-turn-helix domain-containing protein [Lachnospiraceae bacterium OttesenSCG-928-D06]
MIRTIVVDAKPSLIEELITKSYLFQSHYKVIGKAEDGETAWNIILKLKPDVVFLDIEIPILNGLEVLKLCNTHKNPPLCVIISRYSDFFYTQQAIKYNAFDYLLKPINHNFLVETLNSITDYIFSRKQLVQQNFFSYLLHHHPIYHTNSEIDFAFEPTDFYYTYYLCIGSYCIHYYSQFDVLGNYLNEIDFCKQINSFISSCDSVWILETESKNEFFLIYGLMKKDIYKHKNFLSKLTHFIEKFSFPTTLLYGASTNKKSNFKDFFKDYKHLLKNITIFGESMVIDVNQNTNHARNAINVLDLSLQNLLTDLVTSQKFNMFHQQFDLCLVQCEGLRYSFRMLNGLLKRICEIANNNFLPISMIEQVDEIMSNTSSYSDIKSEMHDMLNNIFLSFPENNTSCTVSLIKKYIDNHYTERISLSLLAKEFNIGISYLSTLFKKVYLISPNEYIIQLRIDRAKSLLSSNSELSIKQTAELSGYTDPYYFSRLFKMSVGMTPSDYHSMNCDS